MENRRQRKEKNDLSVSTGVRQNGGYYWIQTRRSVTALCAVARILM
jgi:hypothetical protein